VRRTELTRLKVCDIDSRRMVVHIQGGKGEQDRDVMLSPALLEELRAHWRRLRKKSVWLFPGNRWHSADHPIDDKVPYHACVEAARRAGIKKRVYPHVLRHNIFGLEEVSPYKKGRHPEVFEKVLAVINNMRGPANPIRPFETIMAEDTIGNLGGAKKAGMKTVWVPRRDKDMPQQPSRMLQRKLASVDHIYGTPHEFLDANAAIRAHREAL